MDELTIQDTNKKNRFYWRVLYRDGTRLEQFSDGGEAKFGDIDFSKIKIFQILDSVDNEIYYEVIPWKGVIRLKKEEIDFFRGECKLVYFRRNLQPIMGNITGGFTVLPRSVFHCFGLQVNFKDKNHKMIFMIQDDNGILSVYHDEYILESLNNE